MNFLNRQLTDLLFPLKPAGKLSKRSHWHLAHRRQPEVAQIPRHGVGGTHRHDGLFKVPLAVKRFNK